MIILAISIQTVSLRFKEKGTFSYKLEIHKKEPEQGLDALNKIVREGVIVVE